MGMIKTDDFKINPATGAPQTTVEYLKKGISKPTTDSITPTPAFPTYNPNLSGLQAQLAQMMQGFGQQGSALQQQYQTSLGQTDTAYQNLLQQLAKQQSESREDFGGARATIAEDAFTRGRNTANNLASRNLSGSGLLQLGDVQNRMETGRQVSNVANQYFDSKENIAEAGVQGTQAYTNAKKQLQDSLASQMANLLTQQAGAQMSGLSTIEQLRQAGIASQQNAALQNQNTSQLANSLSSDLMYIAGDTQTSYNQKLALMEATSKNAGQNADKTTFRNILNDEATSKYKSLVAVNGYEDSTAKAFRLNMIALGYPSTLFNVQSTGGTPKNVVPTGWTPPTQKGTVYGELRQSGGRNFMWDGTRWVPKA